MLATLPAAPTLGTMSNSDTARTLKLIEVPTGPAAIDALWSRLDAALAGELTIAPIPEESPSLPGPVVAAMRRAVRPDDPVPGHIAVVVSTSGSTGNPRGVMLTASALTSTTQQINSRAGGDPTWILAIPPTSIGGLNVMIRAHATGRQPIAVSSVGGAERFTDEAFAKAVDAATATNRPIAVSLVPTQLPRLLSSAAGRTALAECSLILVGGAALAPQAARDCQAAGIVVTTTYGMTETSGGCVLNGVPLDGVEIRVDESDQRIWITGPMLAQGYRDGADAIFDGRWLRTNDRGRWSDGVLQVIGRLDDIVSIQGVNVDLVAVEDRLNDHPATTAAIAVPVVDDETHDQRIAMIYVGEAIDRNELRDWIAPILGSIATPSSIHQVDGFISTVSGKVDRRATASQLGLTVDEPDNEELA
jgi:O-succinylbenzoic acid--CoA ligase